MSEEQLKAFLEKVKADTSLQEKLKGASDANDVTAIAKEAGFSISADDINKAQSELSDGELEGVAGGIVDPLSLINQVCPVRNLINTLIVMERRQGRCG
jgi:predicted ribosomally synthesized peptide with nif11-like leader